MVGRRYRLTNGSTPSSTKRWTTGCITNTSHRSVNGGQHVGHNVITAESYTVTNTRNAGEGRLGMVTVGGNANKQWHVRAIITVTRRYGTEYRRFNGGTANNRMGNVVAVIVATVQPGNGTTTEKATQQPTKSVRKRKRRNCKPR